MEVTQTIPETLQTNRQTLLRLVEPVEGTLSTFQSNECGMCNGTGWIRVDAAISDGRRRCECVKIRAIREKLSEIPYRFRGCTFQSYDPKNANQAKAHSAMLRNPNDSYFLCGPYGNGKTHLLYAQYRTLVLAGVPCCVRTTVELLNEIQRVELDPDSFSPMLAQIRSGKRYHLFWDDVDKFKMTDFRYQGLFDFIDTIYSNGLHLTLTSNFTLKEMAELEKLPPSLVRRIDEICKVLEV